MEYNLGNHEDNAKIFKALCDAKRLAILAILREGSQCACDLIEQTSIAQSALSYHMKILIESGIVESWQCGKWTHYKISNQGTKLALALLSHLLDAKDNDNCCE